MPQNIKLNHYLDWRIIDTNKPPLAGKTIIHFLANFAAM